MQGLHRTAAVIAILLAVAPSFAQDETSSVELTPPGKWVLGSSFGGGAVAGGYGDFLEKPLNFDLNIGYEPGGGAWRFGGGIQFGSMTMKPPYDDELEE